MTIKVGINGFGRIGRNIFRALGKDAAFADIEIVGINDLTDVKTIAHLVKYDSIMGVASEKIVTGENAILVDGRSIPITSHRKPSEIPWGSLGADYVLECTGLFTDMESAKAHIDAGAKKVIISAPAKGEVKTIVMGVNEDEYDPTQHHVVSNASCTTTCLAPAAKVVHDAFVIKRGFMTTVHAYTNDQKILDLPHSDLRRARAAAMSIIPTTTGAAKAISSVIPSLKGKFDGYALRVPISTVSIVDFTVELERETTTEELRALFRAAAKEPRFKGILQAVDEPLVSIDYKGDPHSSSIDLQFTMALGKDKSNFVKVVTWYDNEWGYSCRTVDLAALMAKSL